MSRSSFAIGSHQVGRDHPPYVIAEAGVHHDNSVALAKELILQARIAGAHSIKFQTYEASRIAAKWAPTYWNDGSGRTQHDIFASRSRLEGHDYEELFAYAAGLGITFLSTPFDENAAVMLDELGMAAFKIASADITHFPLLRRVAGFGKPVLLSTGASTVDEVRSAVECVAAYGVPVAVLHCNLTYPTPLADANLARLRLLGESFPDLLLGYSDHTQPQDSELACPLSVALGARIIEKHFTLNKLLPEDDHYHAVDAPGLARLVASCADAFRMTATGVEMEPSEEAARAYARRSIVASRSLGAGTVVSAADVDFKRPGTGIAPSSLEEVLGKRLRGDVAEDGLIEWANLE